MTTVSNTTQIDNEAEAAIMWRSWFRIIKHIFRPEGSKGEKELMLALKEFRYFELRAEDIFLLVWKPVGYGSSRGKIHLKNGPSLPARGVVHGDSEQYNPDWDKEAAIM